MENADRIESFSDQQIIEEAAKRLQNNFLKEYGVPFSFGSVRFILHDGKFQSVEEWPRNRRYLSPSGARKIK